MKTPSIYSRLSCQTRIRGAAILHAIVVSLGADSPVEAVIRNWDGSAGDDQWTTNLNWTPSGNVANDDLVFPSSAAQKTNTNDFTLNTNFNSLTFNGVNYTINGTAGNGISIILANGITIDVGQVGPNTFNPNIFIGANQTWTSAFGTLTLNGVVNLSNLNLTVTGTLAGHGFLLNGMIDGGNGTNPGTGTITKNGNSTLTIADDATDVLTTTLNAGSLFVNGSLGALNLQGGTLRGSGSVKGITATGGTISPGITTGTTTAIFTAAGPVTLSNATTLRIDVNGLTPGSQHDQLLVTGANIDLNDALLNMDQSFAVGDFLPAIDQSFVVVSQTGVGMISGQFAQGDHIIVHGQIFLITYSPSSVTLTYKGPFLTWDGGGADNKWSTDANWDFNFQPSGSANLIFPASVPNDSLNTINDIPGLSVSKITFSGNDYGITGILMNLGGGGIITDVASGAGNGIGLNIAFAQSQTFLNTGQTTTRFTGQINLDDKTLTVDGSGNHSLSGPVIGSAPIGQGGIVKNGTGHLSLSSASNTYTGLTLINEGVLHINNANSLGATDATGSLNGTVIASGASLIVESNVTVNDETISLNGTGFGTVGGALSTAGCIPGCTMTGFVGPATDSTINVTANNQLTLAGSLSASAGLTKVGPGTLVLSGNSPNYSGTTTVNAGTLLVNGNYSGSPVNLTGGTLGGGGSVGSISGNGSGTPAIGTVAPGASAGALNANGNVTFGAAATFNVELNGAPVAQYDRLTSSGTVTLGGANLVGSLGPGFNPPDGTSFTILQTTGTITGKFAQGDSINFGGKDFQITYNPNSVVLTAQAPANPRPTATPTSTATPTATATVAPTPTPTPSPTPAPTPGLVGNVSTRLPVGTGDNVLIEGFIVQGPDASTKTIMVRAIGPSLVPFGIPDALANPTLEIRDANNTLIATNDDWRITQVGGIITGDQSVEINGSGLAPGNDFESAIIADLAPGSYTAIVRGVGNTIGAGVVDAFDLSAASPARLANIATRGLIQPGDKLMIAGFIIQNGDVRAVVLAIGPSLSGFGINNALPDTTLQIKDQNGATIIENDNWESDPQQKQELENIGLQPSHPLEAAVVVTLTPGQYTAQVRGQPETTGIGVVQVFFLQ